jgi:hypothetical protein
VGLTQERFKADAQGLIKALEVALGEAEAARQHAATEAAAEEQPRAAEQAAKVEEAARAEKEKVRLEAIAGTHRQGRGVGQLGLHQSERNSQDFRDHLARFPKGVTERMARAKLEALVWVALPQPIDAPALQSFLEEFPNGAHASEAKSKLADLERQAASAREAEEHQRRETEAWASASAAGNVPAFEVFLKD